MLAAATWAAPGDELPGALKGIPRSQACTRADAADLVAGAGRGANAIKADLACAVTVDEAEAMLGRGGALPVDVRPAGEHEAAHLDGALNLAPAQLGSKAFLRDKAVLLVGNGKAEGELYKACASLKRQGFRHVRVLRGGMPSWLAQGRHAVGRGPFDPRPPTLSAIELWHESQFDANLVVFTPAQAALRDRLAHAVQVPEASAPAIKAIIERRRKELRGAPLAAIVLAVDPAVSIDTLGSLRSALAPIPLLVYNADANRFVEDMRKQEAAWLAHARGPKRPACGT